MQNAMIKMCNDAIKGFDANRHDNEAFVKSILNRIQTQQKRFNMNEQWTVVAKVYCCFACSLDREDHQAKYYLQLAYDKLVIIIRAN